MTPEQLNAWLSGQRICGACRSSLLKLAPPTRPLQSVAQSTDECALCRAPLQIGARHLRFTDGTPIYCEWTPTGPDKSLRAACGLPATVEQPDVDGLDSSWYCDEHAGSFPEWPTVRS